MRNLLPLFLDLTGRHVLLVGGGRVAAGKLQQLRAAGGRVRVVSPLILAEIAATPDIEIIRRQFRPTDLDGIWLVVAAATPEVNKEVGAAGESQRVFVNAVDDPPNATAYLSGVVRRDDVTIAISTSGEAPALTALIREALDDLLPPDLADWVRTAREQRIVWRRERIAMDARKPLLLRALNRLYETGDSKRDEAEGNRPALSTVCDRDPFSDRRIPWLSGPEDSWL